jgi:hypothetical protein
MRLRKVGGLTRTFVRTRDLTYTPTKAGGKAVANTSSVADGAAVIQSALDAFGGITMYVFSFFLCLIAFSPASRYNDSLINNAGILRYALPFLLFIPFTKQPLTLEIRGSSNLHHASPSHSPSIYTSFKNMTDQVRLPSSYPPPHLTPFSFCLKRTGT